MVSCVHLADQRDSSVNEAIPREQGTTQSVYHNNNNSSTSCGHHERDVCDGGDQQQGHDDRRRSKHRRRKKSVRAKVEGPASFLSFLLPNGFTHFTIHSLHVIATASDPASRTQHTLPQLLKKQLPLFTQVLSFLSHSKRKETAITTTLTPPASASVRL
jgi:hypothetical protein